MLTNLAVRPPIARTTSQSRNGPVNRAPSSFFKAVGSESLYVVISIGCRAALGLKCSFANVPNVGRHRISVLD